MADVRSFRPFLLILFFWFERDGRLGWENSHGDATRPVRFVLLHASTLVQHTTVRHSQVEPLWTCVVALEAWLLRGRPRERVMPNLKQLLRWGLLQF